MVPRSNSTMCQQIPKACKYSGTHLFKTSKATITTTQKRKKKEEENGFGRRVVLVDGLIHMETGRKMSEKKVFSEKWSLTKGAVTRKYEEKGFRKRDLKQRWPFAKGSFSWKNPQEKGFRTRGSPLQRVHFHGRIRRRKVSETGAALCKGFIFMEESAGERFQKRGFQKRGGPLKGSVWIRQELGVGGKMEERWLVVCSTVQCLAICTTAEDRVTWQPPPNLPYSALLWHQLVYLSLATTLYRILIAGTVKSTLASSSSTLLPVRHLLVPDRGLLHGTGAGSEQNARHNTDLGSIQRSDF